MSKDRIKENKLEHQKSTTLWNFIFTWMLHLLNEYRLKEGSLCIAGIILYPHSQ